MNIVFSRNAAAGPLNPLLAIEAMARARGYEAPGLGYYAQASDGERARLDLCKPRPAEFLDLQALMPKLDALVPNGGYGNVVR